jgi:hypothetical protein
MANGQTPTVRVYVREKGGKRSFHEAPSIPDLSACYWLYATGFGFEILTCQKYGATRKGQLE